MREIYFLSFTHISQASVNSVRQHIPIQIIRRVKPFLLEFSPKRLGDIQMRRVWRQEKQIQSSLLPVRNSFPHSLRFVYSGIIQYKKRRLFYFKREFIRKINDKFRVNVFPCNAVPTFTVSVYKAKTIKFVGLFTKKTNIFLRELPAVGDVSLAACVRFISVVKVYFTLATQALKFAELFKLKPVMFRIRFAFGTSSYPFISSAKLFKKALKVFAHTFFPLTASHSALAVRIRCRLALMAVRIASLSSLSLMTGLRPRPGLVCKPQIPSRLYRANQLLTLISHIPVMAETSLEVRPSNLSRMLWQRMRKQWLLPALKPSDNALCCSSVRAGLFTRPIMDAKIQNILI